MMCVEVLLLLATSTYQLPHSPLTTIDHLLRGWSFHEARLAKRMYVHALTPAAFTGRRTLRERGTYPVVRELHKWEKDQPVSPNSYPLAFVTTSYAPTLAYFSRVIVLVTLRLQCRIIALSICACTSPAPPPSPFPLPFPLHFTLTLPPPRLLCYASLHLSDKANTQIKEAVERLVSLIEGEEGRDTANDHVEELVKGMRIQDASGAPAAAAAAVEPVEDVPESPTVTEVEEDENDVVEV